MEMARSTQHITIPSKVCSGPSWDLMEWAQELGITFFSSQFGFSRLLPRRCPWSRHLGCGLPPGGEQLQSVAHWQNAAEERQQ